MISEYKLYHGAVLSELVSRCTSGVAIRTYEDTGRNLNYIVSDSIGLQIRHATQRLHPWPFTFTKAQLQTLVEMRSKFRLAFLVLVCHTDGILCLPADNALAALNAAAGDQSWLRADRRKGEWYRLYGPTGEFSSRFASGIEAIVEAIS
jgi:hypothetical protein